MKRRSFLAMLGLAPAMPALAASAPAEPVTEYVWEPMQGPHVVNASARQMMKRAAEWRNGSPVFYSPSGDWTDTVEHHGFTQEDVLRLRADIDAAEVAFQEIGGQQWEAKWTEVAKRQAAAAKHAGEANG